MAIQVKASLRKNPQDKKAAGKYYAQVVLAPEMTQRQIIDQIADRCTVTGSDVKAVLDALMTVIKRNLANGSPIRLGDLGSFRPSVSGIGSENVDKFTASNVKNRRREYRKARWRGYRQPRGRRRRSTRPDSLKRSSATYQ